LKSRGIINRLKQIFTTRITINVTIEKINFFMAIMIKSCSCR